MVLELNKLNKDCKDIEKFKKINDEAFPVYERMSMEEIFAFKEDTDTDFIGIYDKNVPIGFAVLLKNEKCGYLYYLAIDKNLRSKGYGAFSLQKIKEIYSPLQIILDFEEININAENYNQRMRRKNFYLKNGFYETGRYTLLNNQRFEVVCNNGELKEDAFKDLLHIIHSHRPEFPNILI